MARASSWSWAQETASGSPAPTKVTFPPPSVAASTLPATVAGGRELGGSARMKGPTPAGATRLHRDRGGVRRRR